MTEAVVAQSRVPVLVERAWQPLRRDPLLSDNPVLLVPLDGSELAEQALQPAAALADDLGAGLTLLRVEPQPTHVIKDEYQRVISYIDQQEELERVLASDYLDSVAHRINQTWPELTIHSEVRFGQPVLGIREAEADPRTALVVMATHGRTGLQRTLFGSVAGQVVEHHSTPVVLFNPSVLTSSGPRGQHADDSLSPRPAHR